MQITSSNFGALLTLTEHHRDEKEKRAKAEELMAALNATAGIKFMLREQFRTRLQRILDAR